MSMFGTLIHIYSDLASAATLLLAGAIDYTTHFTVTDPLQAIVVGLFSCYV